MDIEQIAEAAKIVSSKGEEFSIDASRFSPILREYQDRDVEIKTWLFPFDDFSVEARYKGEKILNYSPNLTNGNFYRENVEFENYISPLAAKLMLLQD